MSDTEASLQAGAHAVPKDAAVVEGNPRSSPQANHLSPADRAEATRAMIVARAARDPAFRAQLLADAPTALKAVGLGLRKGMTLIVVEDSDRVTHLVLPALRSAPPESSRLRERLNPGG